MPAISMRRLLSWSSFFNWIKTNGGLYIGHAIVEAYFFKVEIPVALPHGMERLIERQVLTLRIVGKAAKRSMREHALVEGFVAGGNQAALSERDHVFLLMKG